MGGHHCAENALKSLSSTLFVDRPLLYALHSLLIVFFDISKETSHFKQCIVLFLTSR